MQEGIGARHCIAIDGQSGLNGLLSVHQFGFRKGKSVENQLLETYGEVVE